MPRGSVVIGPAVLEKPFRWSSLCYLGSSAVIVILLDIQVWIVFHIRRVAETASDRRVLQGQILAS